MSLLAAASAWWTGHISAATIQTQLVDPINGLNDSLADGGWQNLTLAGGFTNAGPINLTPAYREVAGLVHLRGYSAGTYTASGTNTIVAAGGIPAGLRPANDRYVPCAANGVANAAFLVIGSDGSLKVKSGATVPAWVSLAVPPWIGDI